MTLSRYTGVDPREWRFRANSFGRPQIAWPRLGIDIDFNLSNTRGLVACIVTAGTPAGVDVESVHRTGGTSVLERCFASHEVVSLQTLSEAQRRRRCFELWTLKEAYVKARGLGLSLPLEGCSFDLEGKSITATFDSQVLDTPTDWQFVSRTIGSHYVLAAAIASRREGISISVAESMLDESTVCCGV
jgi:4'-phosphopantetheinyl transferase